VGWGACSAIPISWHYESEVDTLFRELAALIAKGPPDEAVVHMLRHGLVPAG
jgi:hypothetical protein